MHYLRLMLEMEISKYLFWLAARRVTFSQKSSLTQNYCDILTVWLIQISPLLTKISRQCLNNMAVPRLVTIKPHDFKVIVLLINGS